MRAVKNPLAVMCGAIVDINSVEVNIIFSSSLLLVGSTFRVSSESKPLKKGCERFEMYMALEMED